MSVKCILTEQGGKGGGGSAVSVESITIQTPPSKTSYYAGDIFDPTGMVVMASYALDGVPFSEADVTNNIVVSPSPLIDGITAVTISYTDGNGTTVTATQAVTITHRLTSLEVTNLPTKINYEYGDTLATEGMAIKAVYSDGVKTQITPDSVSPTALNTVGAQAITVTYKDESVDAAISTTFTVNVERKTISIPTWKGPLTYSGNIQSADSASYWDNYDILLMTMGGTTSGIDAGNYDATFTPKDNYRWPDSSIAAQTVQWSIAKKTYTIGLSPATVAIDATNYSSGKEVTVTREGIGEIAIAVDKTPGITATLSGNTIIITGDGKTAGSFNVTVSVAADDNHEAPDDAIFPVTATYFELPFDDGVVGDAAFWSGLKSALAGSSATQRQQCVGRKVKVTLSGSGVLGTTTHFVRCVGYDCDGAKTLTFQTMNTLATRQRFDDNSALWFDGTTDSEARAKCKEYYNAFPGKNSIRSVKKRYCSIQNGSKGRNPDKTYTETVFLPSDGEMGYTQSESYASSVLEFAEENTSKTPYQYYTDNAKRIKMEGTDTDPSTQSSGKWYWTRSRRYDDADGVCSVDSYGDADYYNYNTTNGSLAPAFAIG